VNGDLKLCGAASEFKNHKYLYFTDFRIENVKNLFKSGICVDECPKSTKATLKCQDTKGVKDCAKSVYVYESFALGRYCIPNVKTLRPETKKNWEAAYQTFLNSSAGNYVNDLYLASTAIFASLGMSVIYCFIFMFIMSMFAECISWFIVIIVQLGLIAGAVTCFLLR
jgi:hypothetical protein